MFKFDFFDFIAPLEMGQRDSLTDMTFEQVSFGETSGLDKAPIVAMQALGSGDDFAGDASTTGLFVEGVPLTIREDFSGDIDWIRIPEALQDSGFRLTSIDDQGPSGIIQIFFRNISGDIVDEVILFGGTEPEIFFIAPDSGAEFLEINYINYYGDDEVTLRLGDSLLDDYSGDTSTAGVVEIGGSTVDFVFEEFRDADWFVFNAQDGEFIEFFTEVSIGTSIQIFNVSGDAVSESSLSYNGFQASYTGTYFVGLTGSVISETATYFVAQLSGDDFAGDFFTNGALTVDGLSVSGVISETNTDVILAGVAQSRNPDVDFFAVSLTAGELYTINLTSAAALEVDLLGSSNALFGNSLVPANRFESPDGSQLIFEPERDGTYFVSVSPETTASNAVPVDYSVSIETLTNPYAGDISGSVATEDLLPLGSTLTSSEFNYVDDEDWYFVDLEAGEELDVTLDVTEAGRHWLIFYSLDGPGIQLLSSSDPTLEQSFTARDAGRYFVAVTSDAVGDYSLSANIEYAGNASTTGTIEVDGDFITVSNDFVGDVDWFYISVEMDKSYRLVSEDGHIIPSTIYAYENYFGTVAESQNYNQGTGIFYVDNGFFTDYIIAIEHGNDPSQTFRVEELYDDHIGSERTTSEVEFGETLDGQFNFPQDQDWFVLTIDEAGTYRGQLHAQLLPNRFNLQIIDSDGNEISSTGGRTPSTVTRDYTFEFAGTYFVIAAATSASNNPFTPYSLTLNQIVDGTEGDDTIVLSNSSVILDAGDGDDFVTAGLGNMPSETFTGGQGTDTLDLTVLSYQQIDFRAGSFEIGTLRNTSGEVIGRYKEVGTRDYYTQYDVTDTKDWSRQVTVFDNNIDATWSRKEFTYDENGSLSREKTLLNSGELIDSFIDTAQTHSYQTREITYVSEGGDIASIETLFDSGSSNTVTYDVNNEFTFWDVQSETADAGEIFVWSSVTSDYVDIAGSLVRTRLIIERDDSYTSDETFVLFGQNAGTSIRTLTDTAETEAWDNWVFEYDVSRQVTESTRTNDNGIVNTLTYDRDGLFDWAQRSLSEDTADIFHWTTSERVYDAAGQTMSLEILYDEGFTVLNEYDLDSQYDWGRKVTRTEVDGDITEYYYDDDGALYDTVYI